MTPQAPTPSDRDRAVRRAARLRRTLVGSSALASLGVAAVLGVGAVDHTTSGATSASGSSGSTGTSDRNTPSRGLDSRDDQEGPTRSHEPDGGGDDRQVPPPPTRQTQQPSGSTGSTQPGQQSQTPGLSAGSGSSHATTSGS